MIECREIERFCEKYLNKLEKISYREMIVKIN